MTPERLREVLERVRSGAPIDEAIAELKALPFRELGRVATIDHHRHLRLGFPEVVFGEGKSVTQLVTIMRELATTGANVLATRVDRDKAVEVMAALPNVRHEADARALVIEQKRIDVVGRGQVLVVSAGTSDSLVAEEAVLTLRLMGNEVGRLYDVGIAGVHRTLAKLDQLRAASVLVVVAGMEGALPTLVAGLVDRPVVAVPTSVGYGASFGGLAALLTMLAGCAAGVTAVNIDNGFGAAYAASLMNRRS